MSFGKYPSTSLAETREKHGVARKLLAAGIDPMEQRKEEKNALRGVEEDSFQSIASNGWSIGNRR